LPRRQLARREETSRACADEQTAARPDNDAGVAASHEVVDISSEKDHELNQTQSRATCRSLPTTPSMLQQDPSLRRIPQQSADRTPASDAQITEAVDQAEQLSNTFSLWWKL
jgi:hypothetical protein